MKFPFAFWGTSILNPATLTLNGWWRASYTAPGSDPRWSGTASLGTSGANVLDADGDGDGIPTVGAAVNGFTPAVFSNKALETAVNISSLATAAAGTMFLLAKPTAAAAPGVTGNLDPALVGARTRVLVMGFSTSGFRATLDDGAPQSTAFLPCATGSYHAFICRWNGSLLEAQLDGGAFVNKAAGVIAAPATTLVMGKNPGVAFQNMETLEYMIAPSHESDAVCAQVRAYWRSRYNLVGI